MQKILQRAGTFVLAILMTVVMSPAPVAFATGTTQEAADWMIAPDDAYVFIKPGKTAEVPILMYHLVTANKSLIGKHGISPEELEADLQYLTENAYETVVMADLIAYVYRGRALPKKPVVLTFDDGNLSDYLYLYPLLEKYKAKAVLSIIGKPTDQYSEDAEQNKNARYPNLIWPQIKEMKDKGVAEIQSHSYNMHGANGSAKRKNESVADYQARFIADMKQLQTRCKEMVKCKPNTFAYPLGAISESSRKALDDLGFIASLSCCEGMNVLTQGEPECLFKLKRVNRASGRSAERILTRLQKQTNG